MILEQDKKLNELYQLVNKINIGNIHTSDEYRHVALQDRQSSMQQNEFGSPDMMRSQDTSNVQRPPPPDMMRSQEFFIIPPLNMMMNHEIFNQSPPPFNTAMTSQDISNTQLSDDNKVNADDDIGDDVPTVDDYNKTNLDEEIKGELEDLDN